MALQVGGVLRDLDPRAIALARPRRYNCVSKLQNHPLDREGAQRQETLNRQIENKNLVMSSRWGSTPGQTARLSVSRNFNFNLNFISSQSRESL
jgi:hypothetical protein